MAKIENKTREQVISLMAKHLKGCYKSMMDAEKTNGKVGAELNNWHSGFGNNSKWAHSDIEFGGNTYTFKDREIGQLEFIKMWQKALELSKVRGKVFYDECGGGYWSPKEYLFKKVELFSNPCKEFNTLVKMIQKYTGKTISMFDVFSISVCGKRSSWGDTGRCYYLCYLPKSCETLINFIRKNKTSKDTLTIKVDEYFSHENETEYRIAQYQESEWYGSRGKTLTLTITTPSGKEKAKYEFKV